MANVVHPSIDFRRGPAAPNLGFGFGMSTAKAAWQHTVTPGHNNTAAFQQLASTISQPSPNRPQKRKHEADEDGDAHGLSHPITTGLRDDAMDRSPTPERPKKAPPKKARVANTAEISNKEKGKENKPPGGNDDNEVDIGVLLGMFVIIYYL